MVAKIPGRRFAYVGAPGWHGNAIVTPLRCYGGTPDPNRSGSGAHLVSYKKGPGSLKGWRKTAGALQSNQPGFDCQLPRP